MEPSPNQAAAGAAPPVCIVCGDELPRNTASSVTLPDPCGHSYCSACLEQYVRKCCDDKEIFPPRCCNVRVPLNAAVNALLGPELADRLELMITEHDDTDKLYCSNLRCSRYLRRPAAQSGRFPVQYIRCRACSTSTCRFCHYPNHSAQPCGASLADDQLRALGAVNGWRQCPRCKTMVERTEGCTHMT